MVVHAWSLLREHYKVSDSLFGVLDVLLMNTIEPGSIPSLDASKASPFWILLAVSSKITSSFGMSTTSLLLRCSDLSAEIPLYLHGIYS